MAVKSLCATSACGLRIKEGFGHPQSSLILCGSCGMCVTSGENQSSLSPITTTLISSLKFFSHDRRAYFNSSPAASDFKYGISTVIRESFSVTCNSSEDENCSFSLSPISAVSDASSSATLFVAINLPSADFETSSRLISELTTAVMDPLAKPDCAAIASLLSAPFWIAANTFCWFSVNSAIVVILALLKKPRPSGRGFNLCKGAGG